MTAMMASSGSSARVGLFFTLLFSFLSTVLAQAPAASTYTRNGGGQNLTVSLNVPDNSTDSLYFHFNGPAGRGTSWIAFGFGSSMSDSLMFVAYPSSDGAKVTLSPRLGEGHIMPEHTSDVTVQMLEGSGIINDAFSVNAMCIGCRSWGSDSLDLESNSQAMIWAIGPAENLASDELDAPIRQHQIHGRFSLDIVAATGTAGVPILGQSTSTSGDSGDDDDYNGPGPRGWHAPGKVVAHAVLMIGSFLILYPLGYVVLRVFQKVEVHAGIQTLASLVVIIAIGLGISALRTINPEDDYSHPHTILGLVIFLLVVASWSLGLAGHLVYRKTSQPAKFMIGHRVLGPLTVTLGLINVCVGFNFADNNRPIIPFVVITVLMIIVVSGVVFMVRRRRMRKQAHHTPAAMNFREGQQNGGGGGGAPPPPSYPQATGGPSIPLQTYQPQQQGGGDR